jgi:uncharacterized membrane protein
VPTSRLEAFSDGVFAIAITLLVLEIHVPTDRGADLWQALGEQWPSYAGYVVSFLTIGIIWVNHHVLFDVVTRASRGLLFLNLMLLMATAFIPFTTALMADYLQASQGQDVAAAVYSASFLLMGFSFAVINLYLQRHGDLVAETISEQERRRRVLRSVIGQLAYAVAIALAFVNAYLSLGICALVAVYYIHPGAPLTAES